MMFGLVLLGLAAAKHPRAIFALPQEMVSTSAAAQEAAKEADDAADKTIQTVVKLLDDMLATSKADTIKERDLFAKFKCFCDTTKVTKSTSIANLTVNIDTMTADVADMASRIDTLLDEIDGLTADMQTNEAERGDALDVRNKENSDFLLSEADMATGIAGVDQAITLLRAITPESFLQRAGSEAAARVQAARAAVQRVGVYGDARLRRRLSAWARHGQARDGEIIGVLASLNDTLTVNLDNARIGENKAELDYNNTDDVAVSQWNFLNETNNGKKASTSDLRTLKASTARSLRIAKKQKAADEVFLAATTLRCKQKSGEYSHRQMLRAQEEQAISSAVSILNSDDAFASFNKVGKRVAETFFLQVGAVRKVGKRAEALAHLEYAAEHMSAVSGKQRLGRVATALTGPTPFDEVLALISKQIAAIDTEQLADDSKKAWCTTEQAANNANLGSKNGAITSLNSTAATLAGSISTAEGNIETTLASIQTNAETQEEETQDRHEENAEYNTAHQNMVDAEAILSKAIEVLTKFYKWLRAHEGAHSYVEAAGKDTPPTWNLERLAGKSADELAEACSLEPKCMGYSDNGWLKAKAEPADELFDSDANLFVKTFEDAAPGESLLQVAEEPVESDQQALRSGGSTAVEGETKTFEGAMDGQKENGGKAVEMLQYILDETETERGDATTQEATDLAAYTASMTALKASEKTLRDDLANYENGLASDQQDLEETNEDSRATTNERDAIQAFLDQIEPGCTFIQDHHTDRTGFRTAEKTALEDVIDTLHGTPAFKDANATYVSPIA